jgi:ankyrin repeat protein
MSIKIERQRARQERKQERKRKRMERKQKILATPTVQLEPIDKIYLNKDLKQAISTGSLDEFETLIGDERVDPGLDYNSALCLAVEKGNENMVEKLLAHDRVNASDDDNYPIIKACEINNTNIIKMLLEWEGKNNEKVNPSLYRNRCLQFAMKHNNEEIFNELIKDSRVLSDPYISKIIEWGIGNKYTLASNLKSILESL